VGGALRTATRSAQQEIASELLIAGEDRWSHNYSILKVKTHHEGNEGSRFFFFVLFVFFVVKIDRIVFSSAYFIQWISFQILSDSR
jgi:hypothetical protein